MLHGDAASCLAVPQPLCPSHTIPRIDWRNLFSLISLSPVLHLILCVTLSFSCLSFFYFDCLSFNWNQSSLRSHWDSSLNCCWDWGSLKFSLSFYRDRGNPSLRGALTFSLLSWKPPVWGQVGRQEGAEGFTPKSVPLGHKSGMSRREKKRQHICYFYPFPLYSTELV